MAGWLRYEYEEGDQPVTYGGEDVPARVGEVGVLGGEREVEPRCDAGDVAVEEDEAVAEERPEAWKTGVARATSIRRVRQHNPSI